MSLLLSQFVLSFLWEKGSFSFPLSSGDRTRSNQSLLQHPPLFWPGSQRIRSCEWCRPRDGGELKAGLPEKWDFNSRHPWQRIFTKNGQVWLVGWWSWDREISSGTYGQRREFLQYIAPHTPHIRLHKRKLQASYEHPPVCSSSQVHIHDITNDCLKISHGESTDTMEMGKCFL